MLMCKKGLGKASLLQSVSFLDLVGLYSRGAPVVIRLSDYSQRQSS